MTAKISLRNVTKQFTVRPGKGSKAQALGKPARKSPPR